MSPIHPLYLERELERGMRPDAHLFVRLDWRRFVHPRFADDLPFALYERKYRPDQPRVPAGSREGGQWTEDGGATTELSAQRRRGSGPKDATSGQAARLAIAEARARDA